MRNRVVAVQFQHRFDREEWGEKQYHYLTHDESLDEGDLVVVETQIGYAVAKVIGYLRMSNKAHKYVVQKVDLAQFQEEKDKEMRLSFIQAEIDERAEEIRKRKELETLAADDDRMKKLIAEMDELQK